MSEQTGNTYPEPTGSAEAGDAQPLPPLGDNDPMSRYSGGTPWPQGGTESGDRGTPSWHRVACDKFLGSIAALRSRLTPDNRASHESSHHNEADNHRNQLLEGALYYRKGVQEKGPRARLIGKNAEAQAIQMTLRWLEACHTHKTTESEVRKGLRSIITAPNLAILPRDNAERPDLSRWKAILDPQNVRALRVAAQEASSNRMAIGHAVDDPGITEIRRVTNDSIKDTGIYGLQLQLIAAYLGVSLEAWRTRQHNIPLQVIDRLNFMLKLDSQDMGKGDGHHLRPLDALMTEPIVHTGNEDDDIVTIAGRDFVAQRLTGYAGQLREGAFPPRIQPSLLQQHQEAARLGQRGQRLDPVLDRTEEELPESI